MPQIEQLQVVHWGSLRSDPIELDTKGINVATGGNGAGKTCLLDAAKLILGVDQLKQKPNEYIFDGRGDHNRRAERAYVKAIFRNPMRSMREGRIFADAGRGCEDVGQVTAICEVNRDGHRRYTLLPGAVTWGTDGSRLEDGIQALGDIRPSRWLGPRQWSELLARAGVSRALLGVISVRQGETDRAIEGTPEDLLRRMLELTGKQHTLEEFRMARAKLVKAREEHRTANERLLSERRELERLKAQAARHQEFLRTGERRNRICDLELPTARRRARERQLEELKRERDQRVGQLQQAIDEIEALARELPRMEEHLQELERATTSLERESEEARRELERLAGEEMAAEMEFQRAQQAVASARALADHQDSAAALESAQRAAAVAAHELLQAEAEVETIRAEIAALECGRVPPPREVIRFRALLAERGVRTLLLAEELEVSEEEAVAAEAVLNEGVWTIVVPYESYEEAVAAARQEHYRLPLARSGDGTAAGILSYVSGAPTAGAYLHEIDLPLTHDLEPGVTRDGLVRGRHWASFRSPQHPVLGARARRDALERARRRSSELEDSLPALREDAACSRQRVTILTDGIAAAGRLSILHAGRDRAGVALSEQRERAAIATRKLADVGPEVGRLREEVKTKCQARENAEGRRADLAPRVATQTSQVKALEKEIEREPLTNEQEALGELPSIDALEHELASVVLPRLAEFSDEERSPLAPIQCDDQALAVEEAEEYLLGRDEVVQGAEAEVERARKSYDEHIRQTMHALNRSFKDVCEQAGMEGEIRLEPSQSIEGEWSLDVRVAHTPGEPRRPYQSAEHSGGQRAKISIILLLAAMSIEGSADLLIMDEHIAHLDSRNIDYVADVMTALKYKVQFLLASPTNAEAARLTWCDQQLAFLPRKKGEPYSPPIRIFTRMAQPSDGSGSEAVDRE